MIFEKKKILVWCDDPPEDAVIAIFAGCLANHDRAHSLSYMWPSHDITDFDTVKIRWNPFVGCFSQDPLMTNLMGETDNKGLGGRETKQKQNNEEKKNKPLGLVRQWGLTRNSESLLVCGFITNVNRFLDQIGRGNMYGRNDWISIQPFSWFT